MKKSYLQIFLVYLFSATCFLNVTAQQFTDSNLPIVVISTDNNPSTNMPFEIEDDPAILGNIKIIKRTDGSRNYLTDINNPTHLNCNSRLKIEIRGSSSQAIPKKGYSFTTLQANNTSNNNISILGMPAENDWILNGLAFDQSLIRDYLAYNLSRQMGNYAARTEYCEVVINGQYRGLYLLQEKIKADTNRVNIVKIVPSDNTLPNLSGGYITKADKTTGGDPVAWGNEAYNSGWVNYIHDLPKPIDVTSSQNDYIENQFQNLSIAANDGNISLQNGYTTVIDVPSFVDFMVSNEFAANVDGYQLSTFFHKDRLGKLRAGPIWDFNLTLGNDLFFWGFNRSFTDTWQFANGDNEGSRFWKDLFDNSQFKCYFAKRFHDLIQPAQPLNQTVLNTFIDNTIATISEAIVRENAQWNTIQDYATEIANLKTFIANRTTWMTNNLGSSAACTNVPVPPLVITQINYNPIPITVPAVSSNNQEFIQITNNSSGLVNLSGVYFSQLGISYQFPYNSTIAANSSIYIAANAAVFQTQNSGTTAFGEFTRNLSNKAQNLILSDAFGNIIDQVNYSDTAPWPTAADGQGSFLQLINTNLDNNLASSWVASNANLSNSNYNLRHYTTLKVFPNPAKSYINICINESSNYKIYNLNGAMLQSGTIDINNNKINISNLDYGLYNIQVMTISGQTSNCKVFKD